MQFFVPQTSRKETETTYDGIAKVLVDQLRWPITDRRIFSLTYVHDKKKCYAEVGQVERQEKRYEILAIFESNFYIIFTRANDGGQGVTILVNKDEATEVVDFD